jgi:hypothetical protein
MKTKYFSLLFLILFAFSISGFSQIWHKYAINDSATTNVNQTVAIFVGANDVLNAPTNAVNYVQGPFTVCDYPFVYGALKSMHGGDLFFLGDSLAFYTPPTGFSGIDYFYYGICPLNSSNAIDTAKVVVLVHPCGTLSSIGNILPSTTTNSFCKNSSYLFSINPVSGASYYTWNTPPGVYAQHTSNPTHVFMYFDSTSVSGSFTVTAHNGCGQSITSAPFTFNVSNFNVQYNVVHPTPGTTTCNGSISVIASGGVAPYSYSWSNGNTTSQQGNLCQGNYFIYVQDAMGCSDSTLIQFGAPLVLSAFVSANANCGACNGVLTAIASGGTPPYTFVWSNGIVGSNSSFCNNGSNATYTVVAYDNFQNSATALVNVFSHCDSVWPGETNLDSIVNMLDLFPIGLAFNTSGPVRMNASMAWNPQFAADWSGNLNGVNHKHIDTNGDGMIDSDDTTAVLLNYGLSRSSSYTPSALGPLLTVKMPSDSVGTNQALTLPVNLGLPAEPANDVYAITFSLLWDSDLVYASSINFDASSGWIGNPGTDAFTVYKHGNGSGRMDVAIVRTNKQNKSGFGEIGNLSFTTSNTISGISKNLTIDITDVAMIDASGNQLDVTTEPSSTVVTTLGIAKYNQNLNFRIYPNPSNGELIIENNDGSVIESIDIYNNLGVLCYKHSSRNVVDSRTKLSTELLTGTYYVTIRTSLGVVTKPLSIISR